MCDFAGAGECVPAFEYESERAPFVTDCAKTVEHFLSYRKCSGKAIPYFDNSFPETFVDEGFSIPVFATFCLAFLHHVPRSILCKIKEGGRLRPPSAHKAPQCGAFRGFETAV